MEWGSRREWGLFEVGCFGSGSFWEGDSRGFLVEEMPRGDQAERSGSLESGSLMQRLGLAGEIWLHDPAPQFCHLQN